MEEWGIIDVPPHPPKGGKWVAIIAEIRDNATGIVREYQDVAVLHDGELKPRTYIWDEGDYSCDCNRRLFFARASGEEKGWDDGCSDGLYSVRVRNKKSGRVFYDEFDVNPRNSLP